MLIHINLLKTDINANYIQKFTPYLTQNTVHLIISTNQFCLGKRLFDCENHMKHKTRTQCDDAVFKHYNTWHTELQVG